MTDDPSARYKELLDTAHRAARTHSEHERARSLALIGEIAAEDKEIAAAKDAEAKVTEEVTGWWRRQVAAPLADVSWLTLGSLPTADLSADPENLKDYLAHIEPATDALNAAVRRASWPRRR